MARRPEATATPTGTTTAPGALGSLGASAGDGEVTLTWTPPSSGGTPTSYEYRYKTTGNYPANWTNAGGSMARSVTVSSLDNDTPHTFQVRAVNSAGDGTASEVIATPTAATTEPGAPRSLNASAGDGRVTPELAGAVERRRGGNHPLRVPLQDHRQLPRQLDQRRRQHGPQRDRFQPGQRHAPHLRGARAEQRRRRHGVQRGDRHANDDRGPRGRTENARADRARHSQEPDDDGRGRPGRAELESSGE